MWRGETAEVAQLAAKVDPASSDRFGNTALLSAAEYGDAALVQRLLGRGASVDQGRVHLTPLTLAARRGAAGAEVVNVLRDAGARPSIFAALHLGDATSMKRMLAQTPALANAVDEQGTPLIHHAAETLDVALAALLLQHGAKLDARDEGKETALHRVADLRRPGADAAKSMALFLIERGAEVDARNWDDVTPLHQACRARNLSVVEALLAHGADPNAIDRGHRSTPLRRAVATTGAGNTAGTKHLMLPIARLLLEAGADPRAVDKRGVPVYESASEELRAVLLAFGGKR